MKNLLIVLTMAFAIVSCGSDDNDGGADPNCENPTQFYVISSISEFNSVTIGWEQDGASSYTIEYGVAGFNLGSGIQVTSTSTETGLNDLLFGTNYDFYVRANCSSSSRSEFVGPESFMTPNCSKPMNVVATDVTENTAAIYFQAVTDNNDVEYGLSGFALGTGTVIQVFSIPAELQNLMASTSYDVYVRTACGSEFSEYSDVVSFTTASACTAPTQFSGAAGGPGEVFLFWNPEDETAWRIEYGLSGFALGTGSVVNTSQTSVDINGLQTGQLYEFYIQANCGSQGLSEFVGPLPIVAN